MHNFPYSFHVLRMTLLDQEMWKNPASTGSYLLVAADDNLHHQNEEDMNLRK